jgi:hypothetical protein
MSTHTPGPWTWNAAPPGYLITTTVRDFPGTPEIVLAEVFEDATTADRDVIVADGEPNARLMAAAPELLEALKELTDAYVELAEMHDVSLATLGSEMVAARAAIAKAEGQS